MIRFKLYKQINTFLVQKENVAFYFYFFPIQYVYERVGVLVDN